MSTREEVMAEARGWVSDCEWRETTDYGMAPDEVAAGMTDAEIRAGVERHYDGGWAGFLHASGLTEPEPVDEEVEP